jgi:hypothetical protein
MHETAFDGTISLAINFIKDQGLLRKIQEMHFSPKNG